MRFAELICRPPTFGFSAVDSSLNYSDMNNAEVLRTYI